MKSVSLTVCLGFLLVTAAAANAQEAIDQPTAAAASEAACGACLDGGMVGLRNSRVAILPDTVRPKAIEYSKAYGVRLKIHQVASYTEIPLFVGEYFLGEKLLRDQRNGVTGFGRENESSVKGAHSAVAAGLAALFTINTVTGGWNLWESRKDPAGRTRRWVHTIGMLAADVGFIMTAQAAGDARRTDAGANRHRNLAIGSMSLATASTLMMWLWKD
ncbi:MAG: hypothetical protein ABJC19_09905 [Gemmatimonadota bacterium]